MDPRNTATTENGSVAWTAPSAAETGRLRKVIELHRRDFPAYLRSLRGEIDLYTDEFGCAISSDTTGHFEQVIIAGPQAREDELSFAAPDAFLRRQAN